MTDLATLQQHRLLSQLLALARKQGEALDAEHLDDFLTLMDERDRVVADLVELEQAPPPANVLPFPTISPDANNPDIKAAMNGLIRSILRQDDENEKALRQQMDSLKGAIWHINQAAAAGRAYAAAVRRPSNGLDRAC